MITTNESTKVQYTDKEHKTIDDFCILIEQIAKEMEETYNIYSTPYDDYTQEDIELIKCFVNQMGDGDTIHW